LRFLGIILRVLRLEVSVCSVYITNQFQATLAEWGEGGWKTLNSASCPYVGSPKPIFLGLTSQYSTEGYYKYRAAQIFTTSTAQNCFCGYFCGGGGGDKYGLVQFNRCHIWIIRERTKFLIDTHNQSINKTHTCKKPISFRYVYSV
jgi:hypothetical protein